MKIVDVRATIVDLPRRHSLKTAYGDGPKTTIVVAQVYTDEGITGVGQTVAPAPWYGDSAEAIVANIDTYLRPAAIGQNPFDIEHVYRVLYRALRGGVYAITALEFALWDIKGKALGVPVYQLLGGRCNEGARLHAFADQDNVEVMAETVNHLADQGWTWFKMKIGFGMDEDLARYRALREAIGDRVRFQVDGNTGYTLGEAVQTLTQMESLGGLGLVEQPVRYLDEMATLATRLRTPLQADELLTGPRSVYDVARAGAAHVLHLKIHKYGGLLPSKRMAAIAEAAGLECSVAPYPDIEGAAAAHLAASTPNATWPAGQSYMQDTILTEPLEERVGALRPLDRPGFGVDVDEDKLAWYRKARY